MSEIPTKWAIVEFDWGAEKKHIYSREKWEIGYYNSEDEARQEAKRMIQNGEAKLMAVLEVKALLVPKAVEFTELT